MCTLLKEEKVLPDTMIIIPAVQSTFLAAIRQHKAGGAVVWKQGRINETKLLMTQLVNITMIIFHHYWH